MIYTSNYKNIDLKDFKEAAVSISFDRGKSENYTGEYYDALAPVPEFWRQWKKNKDNMSEEDNTKFYIDHYYDEVLSKLDVDTVYKDLDGKILLCYEEPELFCHRRIVSAWINLLIGCPVPEIVQYGDRIYEIETDRFVKDYLEEVMKDRIDTKGFESLHAWHLYTKAERLEKEAVTNNDYDIARRLKEMAFAEEDIRKNDNRGYKKQ